MADDHHVALLKQGVAAWNAWRRENLDVRPDLSGADLWQAKLIEANLSGANLSDARLMMADLHRAVLIQADLSRADFREAPLYGANLSGAKLIEANLSRAKPIGANLSGADLRGADLSGAALMEADLSRADFREAYLYRTDLRRAKLIEANLSGAKLSGANLVGANFREARLHRALLSRANLGHASLGGADLTGADLTVARFEEADLSRAVLIEADLNGANLIRANLSGAVLRGADLNTATLVNTDLTGADLTGCRIYGVSAWAVKVSEDTRQHNLIITPDHESAVMVDDLEVAQFVYLLLDRKKIRNVMDAVTRRGVLILGRFGDGGLALLQALAAWLRKPENGGYLPLLFDFPRPEAKTYTDTIRTLAGLARFVIVDLSGPSVPQEIMATVDLYEIPFVPILEQKRTDWSMFRDFLVKERVLEPIRFTSQDHLLELLADKVIAPAEKLIEKRQQRLDEIFGRA
jgi:uncharacterized protein YjbI with pentapeptide repeats